MATFEKRGQYQIRAKVRKHGYRTITKTFNNVADAKAWARQVEAAMDRGAYIPVAAAEKNTLRMVLERYRKEICPRLARAGRDEFARLNRLTEALGDLSLAALQPAEVARYRDQRLKAGAAPQTVKHDLGLLNRVLKACVMDWGIPLPHGIVTAQVRKPSPPSGRDRRLESREEEKLLAAAQASKSREIEKIITIALETAARRAEIASMRWEHINLDKRIWFIPAAATKTKTARTVPLSTGAMAVLQGLPRRIDGQVWSFSHPDGITQAFDRICKRAEIEDLRFHDLRHEATSRLFEKGLNMMEVAAITGHKDLKMLKRYTHLKAEDLVARLG
ncbi:site-specific integrase [Desulfurivibrio alkaliphilus]|uniref:Integrase family protein n=1 Tax=Desulfurivibrio alkaliphilus (strain DSM 19089 / UNIQEM U267 / AHT2) TaxID=589865 RepID=D6Z695_DESAT|nr:site-specific integrase [Desulfurivibrio alkaliphilus]ADH86860.1 integrase family protein [Desulfurivibrio alkaliphilus AHT 2]